VPAVEEELTTEDVLALVHEKAREVDEVRVYYALRKVSYSATEVGSFLGCFL
jgi:hypothetical protein